MSVNRGAFRITPTLLDSFRAVSEAQPGSISNAVLHSAPPALFHKLSKRPNDLEIRAVKVRDLEAKNENRQKETLRHYAPASQEWTHAAYSYNPHAHKAVPVKDKLADKLMKAYFNFVPRKRGLKSSRAQIRARRASPSFIVSRASFKETNNSLLVTAYTFSRSRQFRALQKLRSYSTQTETPSSHQVYPPPGFDAEQAKKPVVESENTDRSIKSDKEAKQGSTEPSVKRSAEAEIPIPRNEATSHPKTKAQEERSLAELAAQKTAADRAEEKKDVDTKKEEKKLTLWEKVKKEANHYWDGTKLLATEVKISSKLALKMAAGYELTRREHRQLHRTVQDLGRLVPFSVFVIVPFAEFLLPIALRLFPNLLPSTYEGQKAKDTKAKNLRKTRKEVSNFLRQTLRETGLPLSAANAKKEEFTEFFRKVRTTGESPSHSDVIKVCKLFKDDLALDNLSRPQLVGICRYMNLNTFGTDNMLRYQIRLRMRQIKRDDKAIAFEGVDSLSVTELQSACASRGLRTHSMSPARLREDLQMWLDLRLKYGVPSTLLVLSNAFMYAQGKDTEFDSQIDAIQAVLSSIPEELFHEIELEVHTADGAATNKQRLEVLKEQQELIEEENRESKEAPSPKDDEDIDEKEEAQMDETAVRAEAEDGAAKKMGDGEGEKEEMKASGGEEQEKKA